MSTPRGAAKQAASAASSASLPAGKERRRLLQWLLVGCIATVLFVSWMYMHHTVTTEHLHGIGYSSKLSRQQASDSQLQAQAQLDQVARLYDETRALLQDLSRASNNMSHAASNMLSQSFARIARSQPLLNNLSPASSPTSPSSSSTALAAQQLSTCLKDVKSHKRQVALLQASVANLTSALAAAPATPTTPAISTTPVASTAAASKWLVIGIPSVSRLQDEDYLLHTLDSLARQMPREGDTADLLHGRVTVLVVNVQDRGTRHRRFEEARALYARGAHPQASYFEFVDLPASEIARDPKEGATAQNDQGNANIPGFKVRKQTRNVASVMKMAYARFPDAGDAAAGPGAQGRGQYYLFLEDDMQLCRHGFAAMQYLLRKASRYHPNWLAVRASYGMNGIFMHMRDVPVFARYLDKHQLRRPPDHLVVEWFAGETPEAKAHRGSRANIGFRHNIFDHIGKFSSLRSQLQAAFPRCYELLAEPTLFKVEAFDPAQCPHDDIWPCRGTMSPPDGFRMPFEALGPASV